ncbi:MAG: family N-acetyltransferase, partial [Solirubrobacteraceae bacterium]|nr:family N-acetyltransferase [Solirubrobacteraceae bacterium]
VVGVAMALRRERLWGLSLMSVLDAQQGKGLGAALLERALAYGHDAPAQIVISSEHPAAMRLYARAGLDIHPCVSLFGAVRHRPVASDAVREVDGFEPWMDEVAREVRGAGYGADPVSWLAAGQRLRCVEGRGWSSARGGRLGCLLARDEEAAHALLEAHLAQTPAGGNVVVDFITAGQDWAVAAGLRAGLALSPDGPIFTRGELGTRRAWLPSGAYL